MNNKQEPMSLLDEEELIELEDGYDETEAEEYCFSAPDPYTKVTPLPFEQRRRAFSFDGNGNIRAGNLSAFWLPSLTLQKEINGTVYTVTGSYAGTETLDRKLTRIFENNLENVEDSE